MRAVKYRDVLWAIEYRMGLTPTVDLFEPDAKALASYINVAVLRYYENSDFPEWTFTEPRTPVNHIVPYSESSLKDIWRVLKLFLRDPNTSLPPIDYPFRLLDSGIHVGFEHGPTVWLKYQTVPPMFTSDVWNVNSTYNLGDLVYSPVTGECYSSLVSGNQGNDPSSDSSTTNIFQQLLTSWSSIASQVVQVSIGTKQVFPSAVYKLVFIEPNGTKHEISYVASNQSVVQIANGIKSAMAGSADSFLSGMTVSVDGSTGAMTFTTALPVSIGATFTPASSSFWQLVPFPLALFNQVVRDAYGNALRDAGQTDKGAAEEQGAVQMQGEKTSNIAVPQDDNLTDQVRVPSRYRARQ